MNYSQNLINDKDIKDYCTFYIVRHGEAQSNATGIIAGHWDYALSEQGTLQAGNRSNDLKSVHFDAAFSSDLTRAKQTTEIIALQHKLAVKTRRILRERHWGTFQGKKREEVAHLLDQFNRLTGNQRLRLRINPLMETSEEIIDRFILFIRETAVAFAGKTVLVGTHGNIMLTFLDHIGFDVYQNIVIDNTGYFVLLSDGIDFFIQKTEGIRKKYL